MKSQPQNVKYVNKLPSRASLSRTTQKKVVVLFVDQKLKKQTQVRSWSQSFDLCYYLKAGEYLKSGESYLAYCEKLVKALSNINHHQLVFVAVGGGSVGDFVGFLASTFKRGVDYVNIPSTWLAAVDSAHGGKTGININSYKNQIGTFYPASFIFICRDLLMGQPPLLLQQSMGEIAKTVLIQGGGILERFKKIDYFNFQVLLKKVVHQLPELISVKYKIVKKDPYETKGVRQILNLGHTIGHVFESYYKLPHGLAVGQGLLFALELSYLQGYINSTDFEGVSNFLYRSMGIKKKTFKVGLTKKQFVNLLLKDKKASGADCINFIYIRKPGRPFVQSTSIELLWHHYSKYWRIGSKAKRGGADVI